MTNRLLLAGEDPGLVAVLADVLAAQGYAVESALDGEMAIAKAASGAFDLVLLDAVLPGANGFDVCHELRGRGADIPILMLTARAEVMDKVLGLSLGADDCMARPFDQREFLARIQALLRRTRLHQALGPTDYQFGRVWVDFLKGKALRDAQPVNLSAKELRLLRYLITRRGATVSREELLGEVWGYRSLLTRTVDVHVATLRHKLEENPEQPRYIVTVRGEGYMFRC